MIGDLIPDDYMIPDQYLDVKPAKKGKRIKLKEGDVVKVKCVKHGFHIGSVSSREKNDEEILIKWRERKYFLGIEYWKHQDFVAPIYDVIGLVSRGNPDEEEIKLKKSKFY